MPESFDPLRYIASYPDLIAAFGANAAAGQQHWTQYGQAEGRNPKLFDPFLYGATHADLADAFGADSDALSRHYIQTGFGENRATTGFDALRYGASNPDVASFYGTDEHELAGHYLRYGRDEGRSIDSFEALQYAAVNPDLARHFRDDVEGLTQHYILHGVDENRPTSGFDALRYGASNDDLTVALGYDEEALLLHWVRYGVDETRPTTSFDPREYLAVNPDLVLAGHDTSAEALQYYLSGGYNDNRPEDGFDEVAYWLSHPDLAAAGLDPSGALDHWIRHGIAEGRVGDDYFGREQQPAHLFMHFGNIDSGADRDWYSVNLTQGASAGLSVISHTPTMDLDLYLYDSEGNLVASDLDLAPGGTAVINYLPSSSGLHYVVVRSGNFQPGSYEMKLGAPQPDRNPAYVNNDLGPGVVYDGSAPGYDRVDLVTNPQLANSDFQGFQLIDAEQFRVTNNAGRPITIDMSGVSGLELLHLGGTASTSVNDVTSLAEITLSVRNVGADVSVRYRDSVVAGDTTVVLTLIQANFDDLTLGSVSGGGIEHLIVIADASSGGGSTIDTLIADVQDITFLGRIHVKIEDALPTSVRTITSNLAIGDLDLDLSNHDGAGQGVNFRGSDAAGYIWRNIIVFGDASDTVVTFGGADVITTGAGSDNVSTGTGNDRIIAGAFLDSTDRFDGGADGGTVEISGRNYVDADFGGLSNVVIEVSDISTVTVGEILNGTGVRRIFASSSGASTIDAGAFHGGITVDASGGGNDNVITGNGNDTGIAGIGSQTFTLNGGDDVLLVSGTEWGIGDSANGGSGFDRFQLDNRLAAVTATVDLGTVADFELFETIDGGHFQANVIFTGGSAAVATPIEIQAKTNLTATISAGLTDSDYAFTMRGSPFSSALVKANVGVANRIDYIGGTGVDTLTVNAADLVPTLTMDGGLGNDVLAISGGTLTDSGFAHLDSVERVTGTGLAATIGAQAMAAGIREVDLVNGGANVVVGAGFTAFLAITLRRTGTDLYATHPVDHVDASASGAPVAFISDSGVMQAGDVLIGSGSSTDVLNLTYLLYNSPLSGVPPLPPMSLAGVTGVEAINVVVLDVQGSIRYRGFGPVLIDTAPGDLDGVDFLRVNVIGTRMSFSLLDAPIDGSAATANLYVTGSLNVKTGSGNDRILLGPDGTTLGGAADSGSGNDRIAGQGGADTINGGAGLDRIVGGLGADALTGGADSDTFLYTSMADSRGTVRDTITGFLSGTDVIDVRALDDGGQFNGDIISFAGNAANLAAAQALLTPGDNTLDAVFQQDQNILWFDNGDGVLNATDLQIILTGVAGLTAADVLAGMTVQAQSDFLDTFFI